jgi:hypothetical protein
MYEVTGFRPPWTGYLALAAQPGRYLIALG